MFNVYVMTAAGDPLPTDVAYSILYMNGDRTKLRNQRRTTILVNFGAHTAAISTMQAKAGGNERKIQRTVVKCSAVWIRRSI